MPMDPIYYTVKELAAGLGRNEQYVTDMKKGGFQLPCTLAEALDFIKKNAPITQFRRTRFDLYSHDKKTNQTLVGDDVRRL